MSTEAPTLNGHEVRFQRYGRAALKRAQRNIVNAWLAGLPSRKVARDFLSSAAWVSALAHGGALDLKKAGEVLRGVYRNVLPNEGADLERRMRWAREQGRANPLSLADRHRDVIDSVPEELLVPTACPPSTTRNGEHARVRCEHCDNGARDAEHVHEQCDLCHEFVDFQCPVERAYRRGCHQAASLVVELVEQGWSAEQLGNLVEVLTKFRAENPPRPRSWYLREAERLAGIAS